jgi:monothiol glutaredoxin
MTETTEANPVHDWIAKSVEENPVVLFMKGVPEQPQCGFSAVSVQILDHLGVDFVGVDVLQSDALARASRPSPTGRPSRSSM